MSSDSTLRVGMIGLDTSHCVAFTRILNDAAAVNHVRGARVTAAIPVLSPDMEASVSRVGEYTAVLREEFGVRMVPTIDALCREVDAVMIVSLDGRAHLEQARPVLAAGKRLFIDKPLAGSLRDGIEIFRLARETGVPIFSSSAYRFYPSLVRLMSAPVGVVRAAISYGPAYLEPHHPDLFFYGIHPAQALFAVMGCGCEFVVRVHAAESDVVTGYWQGGRLGVLHGLRTKAIPHKVIVFGSSGFAEQETRNEPFSKFGAVEAAGTVAGGDNYAALVREIVAFFQSGVSPVSAEETMELFAFLEAADESKRRGGVPVKLSEVLP